MNQRKSLNSVFPYLENDCELKSIPLRNKKKTEAKTVNFYSDRRVKISNWQDRYLCEPRDNTEFFPPKGNLLIASYKTFGTYDSPTYLTETKEKIGKFKSHEKCSASVKLLNIFSFPLTETTKNIAVETGNENCSNPENLPAAISDKSTDTLYRRSLGYSLENLERQEGVRTFLDDDMDLHKKIATLKNERYNR